MRIKQNLSDIFFDLTIHILLVLILLIVLYPLIYVLSASFSSPEVIVAGKLWVLPKGFTLSSYEAVFKDKYILQGYGTSIFITVVGTFSSILVTFLAAYALSRKDFVGGNFFMALFTFTMFFSGA